MQEEVRQALTLQLLANMSTLTGATSAVDLEVEFTGEKREKIGGLGAFMDLIRHENLWIAWFYASMRHENLKI